MTNLPLCLTSNLDAFFFMNFNENDTKAVDEMTNFPAIITKKMIHVKRTVKRKSRKRASNSTF